MSDQDTAGDRRVCCPFCDTVERTSADAYNCPGCGVRLHA